MKKPAQLFSGLFFFSFFLTTPTFAAFVESAIGNAVVNDASAVYYNPAAMTEIRHLQFVASESVITTLNTFHGQTVQIPTQYTQVGSASSRTYNYLPSVYMVYPINDKLSIGIGELYTFYGINDFGRSILRYSQVYNFLSTINFMVALGYKLTDKIALGAGIDYARTHLELSAYSGFPTLGIPDTKSVNKGSDSGVGAHIGILFKPKKGTTLGLTYHSLISYDLKGNSVFKSLPPFSTDQFSLRLVTPESMIFSIDQFTSTDLGFILTIQRMLWANVNYLNLRNVAFKINGLPVVIPLVKQAYFLRNTWRLTFGTHYQLNPTWMIRASVSNDQDPTNPSFQLATGDNIIVALSASYKLSKQFKLDFTYAHIFFRNIRVHYTSVNNAVFGRTGGNRDAASLKLTYDVV